MPDGSRLRVVVADDHPQVLEEMRELLTSEFEVVESVRDGLKLIEAAERTRPDAVISDISMPRMDSIEAAERILQQGSCEAIVVLTMHNDSHLLRRAMDAGIRGFVLKVDAGEELIEAVRAAQRGATYISRGVKTR